MLKKIQLQNFRNYRQAEIALQPKKGITYLIGENAQGKTNILEAIYLLAIGKSFRAGSPADLILWEEEYARVIGYFENQIQRDYSLEIFLGLPPQPRAVFKKNDVKLASSAFIGNCQVVFFHPEDLNILYLGPDLRRRYLDIMNIQVKREYFTALKEYKRYLAQRNALLKAIKNQQAKLSDLAIWNEQLAEAAIYLYLERAKTLEYIEKHLADKYRQISQGNESLRVIYKNSFGFSSDEFLEAPDLHQKFTNLLESSQKRDLQAEFTTIGPHRDDFEVLLNNKPIHTHASRGEYRSIVLSLKMIEIDFFKSFAEVEPILLLDDVFSELDHERQVFMLGLAQQYQTLITTTKDSAVLNTEKFIPGAFFEVKGGAVSAC